MSTFWAKKREEDIIGRLCLRGFEVEKIVRGEKVFLHTIIYEKVDGRMRPSESLASLRIELVPLICPLCENSADDESPRRHFFGE